MATNQELRSLLKSLKAMKGKHTELVSVYVPADYSLVNVLNQLGAEAGTACNIKDKTTMKNVVGAIEKAMQVIRQFDKTPDNGLVVFCGNVSGQDGVQDLRAWSLEPPEPSKKRLYRCSNVFITEPLEELISDRDKYGLLVMDNKEATIGVLNGNHYSVVSVLSSGYHGKHSAGGWSQARFEHIIENESKTFKKRVAERMADIFLSDLKDLKGLIVGGCGMTKDDFVRDKVLNHELQKKVVCVVDTGYTDEHGLKELVEKSSSFLKDTELMRQRGVFQRLMKEIINEGKYVLGAETLAKLEAGVVDTVLVSDSQPGEVLDRVYGLAKTHGSKVEVFSPEAEEGNQIRMAFGGMAGILRY
jgi:peptide chain release factor subunit 1